MITINPNFSGFKDFIKNLLPYYIKENDTYKDVNGEGLFERYMALFGESIDNEQANQIENYLNILDASIAEEKHLSHISDVLGNPPDVFKNLEQYRNLLSYIVNVYRVKGTSEGYKLFFYILGFYVEVENILPTDNSLIYDNDEVYDDGNFYEPASCLSCSFYNIIIRQINSVEFDIDQNTIALLNNAISFNEPINAKLKSFVILLRIEDTIEIQSITDTNTLGDLPPSNDFTINWQFTESGAGNGDFNIYTLLGQFAVQATVTGSGTYTTEVGEEWRVDLWNSNPTPIRCFLSIYNETDSISIFSLDIETSDGINTAFTPIAGRTYTIIASVY